MGENVRIYRAAVGAGFRNAFRLAGGFLPFVIPVLVLIIENIGKKSIRWDEFFRNDPATTLTLFLLAGFEVLVLIPCLFWEFVRVRPRLRILPRKDGHYLSIVIYNDEVEDLTDLRVQLLERRHVSQTGAVLRSSVDIRNSYFPTVDKIGYGDCVAVKIAESAQNVLVFTLKADEVPEWEEAKQSSPAFDAEQVARYKITIVVRGRIDGRPIVPREFRGVIDFWRAKSIEPMETETGTELVETTATDIRWRDGTGG